MAKQYQNRESSERSYQYSFKGILQCMYIMCDYTICIPPFETFQGKQLCLRLGDFQPSTIQFSDSDEKSLGIAVTGECPWFSELVRLCLLYNGLTFVSPHFALFLSQQTYPAISRWQSSWIDEILASKTRHIRQEYACISNKSKQSRKTTLFG